MPLKRTYDPKLPYVTATYLRMSDPSQNSRSPDQQRAEIVRTVEALKYPWSIAADFRDDGITGRIMKKRPAFMRMLAEIESGRLKIDLILVDTMERFGRFEALPIIQRQLRVRHGVLIVTADKQFADPTTPGGELVNIFENFRATDANRIKAHDVLRGKRDAILQGHWPGGPVALGLMLESVIDRSRGRQEVSHRILVPNCESDWIIGYLFELAERTAWGTVRLSRDLNDHPDIPGKFKPFLPSTVGFYLDNPIYYGELLWAKHTTDIVDDNRVIERNAPEDVLRVPNFCPAIVPKDRWDAVQAMRQVRRDRCRPKRIDSDKLIAPMTLGLALKYPLSGLVFCGECGLRMTASCCTYESADGTTRRYVHYICNGKTAGTCMNSTRIPEEWLRRTVINRIRDLLFPHGLIAASYRQSLQLHVSDKEATMIDSSSREPDWLIALTRQVQTALEQTITGKQDNRPALESELSAIRDRKQGWSLSLGNPTLPTSLRTTIESDWAAADDRERSILECMAQFERENVDVETLLQPAQVLERLDHLAEILGREDPTRANIELSTIIDRIDCFSDGTVRLRLCKLGMFPEARELLADEQLAPAQQQGGPRTRSPLRVPNVIDDSIRAAADFAADTTRFGSLSDEWFWVYDFTVPDRPKSWAETNAESVFRRRQDSRLSLEKLAVEFRVTKPTIKAAIKAYEDTHPGVKDAVKLLRGSKRGPRIDVAAFADEAADLLIKGWSRVALAKKFKCSTPVITKALKLAFARRGEPIPTRESIRRANAKRARELFGTHPSLSWVASQMEVSTASAREYLRASCNAEGTEMPDLRRAESRSRRPTPLLD